jgi:UrcA family protein
MMQSVTLAGEMMMKAIKLSRPLAVLLPLLMASAVVQAAPAEPTSETINISGISRGTITRKTQVNVSDLNLADASGQRVLEGRISYASRQVCDKSGIIGLQLRADYQSCLQGARSSAQEQLARVAFAQAQSRRELSMR